jgi:exopolyphosphatase/guanosine-5'-triphosphate,3'-diphosphate pyrophosphatase
MRVAVIDVGTFSTRLVIAEVDKNGLKILYEEGHITALGREVKKTGYLKEEAIKETYEVIKKYKKLCEEYKVEKCLVLGTEALRIAKNREQFVNLVTSLGLEIKIIPPEEEGKYAYIGAYFAVKPKGKNCVVDQGGGSTEFIFGEGLKVENVISLPFGIVTLTERFIKHDPPTGEEIEELIEFIDGEISKVVKPIDTLVGLGGTITTVAALEYNVYPYDPQKINGKVLKKESIKYWFEKLSKMSVEERKRLPQVEDRRAEAIISGIAVFWRILELFKKDEIVVSDWSVKEGAIIYNFLLTER